jgi:hypothetical protein
MHRCLFFFFQRSVCLSDSKHKYLPPFLNVILMSILTFRSANDAGSVVILGSSDSRTLIQILMYLLKSELSLFNPSFASSTRFFNLSHG